MLTIPRSHQAEGRGRQQQRKGRAENRCEEDEGRHLGRRVVPHDPEPRGKAKNSHHLKPQTYNLA